MTHTRSIVTQVTSVEKRGFENRKRNTQKGEAAPRMNYVSIAVRLERKSIMNDNTHTGLDEAISVANDIASEHLEIVLHPIPCRPFGPERPFPPR